jgi:hypothetical protein
MKRFCETVGNCFSFRLDLAAQVIWRQGRNTQVIKLMNETCDGPLKGDLSLAVFEAQVALGNVYG